MFTLDDGVSENNITKYIAIAMGAVLFIVFLALFITATVRQGYVKVQVLEQQYQAMEEWGV
jgi:hypothetical protein